jgi:adenylosuccinate synthase
LFQDLCEIAPQILPYSGQSWRVLDENRHRQILFEGAQGVMLDIDHGTYPFVTSSNTVAANASVGSGFAGEHHVLGVAKAYVTRVGSGPFPTRATEAAADIIGQRGNERGTVTGRKRDCGWFDAVMARQAIKVAGIHSLVLTKIDVLDTFPEIPICVGYRINGKLIDYLPAGQREQALVEPVYEYRPGWNSSTRGIRDWNLLPAQAQAYVGRLEELIEIPISVVSTSPERMDTIVRLLLNPKSTI